MKESTRQKVTTALAWGGWLGAFVLVAVLTYYNISRPLPALPNTFQRLAGLFVILFMGIGIAAGTALSRMKLGRTITRVFEAGYEANRVERARERDSL